MKAQNKSAAGRHEPVNPDTSGTHRPANMHLRTHLQAHSEMPAQARRVQRSIKSRTRAALLGASLCSLIPGLIPAAMVASGFSSLCAAAAADTAPQKVIQGKVLDDGDAPQPGAIVYLKSAKSNEIKSYIADATADYRFGQLAPDTDYTLWAELHGKKSAVRTIPAFDTRKQSTINLHVK